MLQYDIYKKQEFESRQIEGIQEILSYRIDQSFLAYLMTMANKNKSKKNQREIVLEMNNHTINKKPLSLDEKREIQLKMLDEEIKNLQQSEQEQKLRGP